MIAALLAAALLGPVACGGPPPDLRVAAAASLRDLLQDTAPGLPSGEGAPTVAYSFDASSRLARQIEAGADYDVFVSADAETLDRVADWLDGGTRRAVLGNRLALVGREGLDAPPDSPADLVGRPLRVAVAGAAVPAGRYARRWLEQAGLLASLQAQLVDADHVRAALALVESGAADVALVYRSDAQAARTARTLWVEPSGSPGIRYEAAALLGSHSPHADAFLDGLLAEPLQARAARLGFAPPPEAGP